MDGPEQQAVEHPGFRESLPARVRAVGIHFLVSAAIFAVALYLILVHWYPGFHFGTDGGWQGTRIMLAVDFVLGPVLTLVIFNPFKARKAIIFDLSVIGLIQASALAWGFYAVESQRPVAFNYYQGEFYSVVAAPIIEEKYELSMLDDLSDENPRLIYVRPPEGDDEETRAAMMEVLGGAAEHEDPLRFEQFAPRWEEVKVKALDVEQAKKANEEFAAELEAFLEEHETSLAQQYFFPFNGRYGACTVAFHESGKLTGALGCRSY